MLHTVPEFLRFQNSAWNASSSCIFSWPTVGQHMQRPKSISTVRWIERVNDITRQHVGIGFTQLNLLIYRWELAQASDHGWWLMGRQVKPSDDRRDNSLHGAAGFPRRWRHCSGYGAVYFDCIEALVIRKLVSKNIYETQKSKTNSNHATNQNAIKSVYALNHSRGHLAQSLYALFSYA